MSSTAASKPVTQGGFSNDGSSVMKQFGDISSLFTTTFTTSYQHAAHFYDCSLFEYLENHSELSSQSHQLTISTTLHSSMLTLDQFYNLEQISNFLSQNIANTPKTSAYRVAIQCPDEILVDCNFIVKALQKKYKHTNIQFYILGDTSYSSCCVDVVAARHVEADFIIHLGFACLSQSEILPVFYAFGSLPLFDETIVPSLPDTTVTNANTTLLYQYCLPLLTLIFKICSSSLAIEEIDFSPGYDDYEEYPDELLSNTNFEKTQVLVFPDQRYSPQIHVIQHIFTLLGFDTRSSNTSTLFFPHQLAIDNFFTNIITPYLQQHINSMPLFEQKNSIELVFASPTFGFTANSPSCCNTSKITNSFCCNSTPPNDVKSCCSPSLSNPPALPQQPNILQDNVLKFAGFEFPISLPKDYNADQISSLSTRQIWHRFFNKSQWKFLFLSNHIPFFADSVTDDAATVALQFKTIPDPSSATFLTHLAMNFTQHYIYDCFPYFSLPFTLNNNNDIKNPHQGWLIDVITQTATNPRATQSVNTIPPTEFAALSMIELFSPSREQSRVLSQRFYLVEKAKNSPVIGIVVCTLSAKSTIPVIERLKKLLNQNGIKCYVIVIGKLNEAKLLNFGDISLFVVVSCPLGVLFRFQNKHGQLHHTSIDQYSIQKVGDVKQAQNNTPTTIASMIDLITPYECELAFNTGEFSWNGSYTTHFSDVHANSGRFGLKKESIGQDDLEALLPETISTTSPTTSEPIPPASLLNRDSQFENDGWDVEDESVTGVRYSSIDGKYHQINPKKTAITTSNQSSESSTQLIEQQTFGLIDPTTNKQLIFIRNPSTGQVIAKEREFTGLAQDYELTAENMAIQPGLHGTSEGYISVTDRNASQQDAKIL